MPFSVTIPNSLIDLGNALSTLENESNIYFYKDAQGNILTFPVENSQNDNNFGYPYNFISGEQIYTNLPITSLLNIPWSYPYTGLTSYNLWNDKLKLWIDSNESKAFNNTTQKLISKDYSNNYVLQKNTTPTFTHAVGSLTLSNLSSIETVQLLPLEVYFKLGIVFSIPNPIIGRCIMQINRFKLELRTEIHADESIQDMIAISDNGTFLKGITLNPDPNYKYFVYTDSSTVLTVGGNTAVVSATNNYFQAVTSKFAIGGDSTSSFQSNIILHELFYFSSNANDITPTYQNFSDYFVNKWGIVGYNDIYNVLPIPPITYSWDETLYGWGDRRSRITISTNFGYQGNLQNMLDGTESNTGSAPYFVGQTITSSGWIKFTFLTAQYIGGIKWFLSSPASGYARLFDIYGSNDDISYTLLEPYRNFGQDIGVNVSDGAIIPQYTSNTAAGNCYVYTAYWIPNYVAYKYIKLVGVSGSFDGGPYDAEFNFMVGAPT